MEQEDLIMMKQMLKELRQRVLDDEQIKDMFNDNFPQLSFEEEVDNTLADLEEYAIEKDFDILTLSLQGVKLFFSSVFDKDEDENEEEKEVEDYGKA
jgi:tRNA splicing endonuclease